MSSFRRYLTHPCPQSCPKWLLPIFQFSPFTPLYQQQSVEFYLLDVFSFLLLCHFSVMTFLCQIENPTPHRYGNADKLISKLIGIFSKV